MKMNYKLIHQYKHILIPIGLLLVLMTIMLISYCYHNNTIEEFSNSNEESNVKEGEASIQLNETTIESNSSSVIISNSTATITKSGTYYITGTLLDGQIIIDASKTDDIIIVLQNANITCSSSSPIYAKTANSVTITLEENTTNTVTDTSHYIYTNSTDEEPNATIFSKCDLTISGYGTLMVNSNFTNAIFGKDDVIIESGTIQIEAKDNGLKGRDLVQIIDGDIDIKAGGNAIRTTNTEDTTKGNIVIDGGNITMNSDKDGIDSENSVTINNGNINIVTGRSSSNATKVTSNTPFQTSTTTSSISTKGIKTAKDITIMNGNITIDSLDDSIHSNSNIKIEGGVIHISSGDDGIHADTNITINSGDIIIDKSYEGIESSDITINGGNITITSSDDGINAAGGNDGSSINGRAGQNNFNSQNSTHAIHINGGNITVNASGDGLDANGSIYMSAGTVIVNGPTSGGNGALDYDAKFEISGGSLIAAGSSAMAQSTSTSSKQVTISLTLSTTKQAGTKVVIKDSSHTVVSEYTSTKSFSSVIISNERLTNGSTYSVYIDDTKVKDITISPTLTNIRL